MTDAGNRELLAAARDAATRNVDYYELLGLDSVSPDAITRESVQHAWRKRSLLYHPDKAGNKFEKSKWEEFGLARDILASDEARQAYDAARSARLHKQREKEAMSARQRRFAEELEEAEGRRNKAKGEVVHRRQEDEQIRATQAAGGRKIVEERQRLMREAEERERDRASRENEATDDRIRYLQGVLAEKSRRKAERKARKEGRKDAAGAKKEQTEAPSLSRAATKSRDDESSVTQLPERERQSSDDPVQFWTSQWPKTKARLKAAQAAKEQGTTQAAAGTMA